MALKSIFKPVFGKNEAEIPSSIGQMSEDENIYGGTWEPKYHGQSLGAIFDLYAWPRDLEAEMNQRTFYYREAVELVSKSNQYGAEGIYFVTERDILQAIRQGHHKKLEKWFIPPMDVAHNNLYLNRNEGAFKGTFRIHPKFMSSLYMTSTEAHHLSSCRVLSLRFSDSYIVQTEAILKDPAPRPYALRHEGEYPISCRPVRAKLRLYEPKHDQ
jgi:hypothetical protein